MDNFIYYHGKKLRCGYTTGSCAAAAAAAAARALLSGSNVETVRLVTPSGAELKIPVGDLKADGHTASCSVVKDGGDDPDITHGMKIFSQVTLTEKGITIDGGKGIGRVTKPGLDQPVGAAAINSTPRKMIAEALEYEAQSFGYSGGFSVVISAPEGEKIAKKTFNPRLGIVGGISVIGTTGIVEPMSSAALVETIRTEASVRRAEGMDTLVLTVGNFSRSFIEKYSARLSDHCVTCSNYIGEAVDIGISLRFSRILVVGHLGKLVKLGSGIMNTHSHEADGRRETLMVCAALSGAEKNVLEEIDRCVTTDAALTVMEEAGCAEQAMELLTKRVERYLSERVNGQAMIGAVIFDKKHNLQLMTAHAEDILKAAFVHSEEKNDTDIQRKA